MDKEMAGKILGHQLKGIMLHSDLYKTYLYKQNMYKAKEHYQHVLQETKNFMRTLEHFVAELGMVDPAKETPIAVPPDSTEDKLTVLWKSWESDTMVLYQRAYAQEPRCMLWKKLLTATMKELL